MYGVVCQMVVGVIKEKRAAERHREWVLVNWGVREDPTEKVT